VCQYPGRPRQAVDTKHTNTPKVVSTLETQTTACLPADITKLGYTVQAKGPPVGKGPLEYKTARQKAHTPSTVCSTLTHTCTQGNQRTTTMLRSGPQPTSIKVQLQGGQDSINLVNSRPILATNVGLTHACASLLPCMPRLSPHGPTRLALACALPCTVLCGVLCSASCIALTFGLTVPNAVPQWCAVRWFTCGASALVSA
jgi:hypothetical protein